MKVLLTVLNSKFIHSASSIRYIKSYCDDAFSNIEIAEYTINQQNEYIAREIFKKKVDVVAFSCYIWNIEQTLEIAQTLKMVKPDIKIVLGGPEVSFDGKDRLEKHSYIDFVVYGEGEATFKDLLFKIEEQEENYRNVAGLVYRENREVVQNQPRPLIQNLDEIPSPFVDNFEQFENKIVYYESSRGCPFNCQFCLSSTMKGVRYFSMERVKEDIGRLIDAGVKQVKFADRTFNAKKEHAMEIIDFIMSKNVEDINFHFEVTAHLVEDDMLEFLKDVPEGLLQFEIGVQSTNPHTLKAIDRKTNFDRLSEVVKRINSYNNIHQHLDLIAGLPYENYESFRKSFNDIYNLKAEKLQLGFLKLLKGTGLRARKDEYGFKFLDKPPYELIENKYIKYEDMMKLKIIEDLVEKYSNEENFENTLQFIIELYYETPFDFFEYFAKYWENNKFHEMSHSKRALYDILYKFYSDEIGKNIDVFNELIRYDFIVHNKNANIPSIITKNETIKLKNVRHDFLKQESNINKYLKQYSEILPKKLINEIHLEEFSYDIIKFIENGYDVNGIIKELSVILFVYDKDKKVFNKCKTYNVTNEIMKEV